MLWDKLELGEDGKIPNVLGEWKRSAKCSEGRRESTLFREAANSLTTFFLRLR